MTISQAFFVTHADLLSNFGGGAQICTREYLATLRAANLSVTPVPIHLDRSIATRVVRKIFPSPYIGVMDQKSLLALASEVARARPNFIFLNQVNLAPIASFLRQKTRFSGTLILLSHGAEITDFLHFTRLAHDLPLSGSMGISGRLALGNILLSEARHRRHCHGVVTLSAFDANFEQWLGARHVAWLPRTIPRRPLEWRPRGDRLGYVGTLDHSPNLEGLVETLTALKTLGNTTVTIRVVGGPPRLGEWLSSKYSCVRYLGTLDEQGLVEEASTWNAFIHPIFCQARGCSTKLATAMGWQIPVVTTAMGRRGYTWRSGTLTEQDNPIDFARACLQICDLSIAARNRDGVKEAAESSPTIAEVSQQLGRFLERIGCPGLPAATIRKDVPNQTLREASS